MTRCKVSRHFISQLHKVFKTLYTEEHCCTKCADLRTVHVDDKSNHAIRVYNCTDGEVRVLPQVDMQLNLGCLRRVTSN